MMENRNSRRDNSRNYFKLIGASAASELADMQLADQAGTARIGDWRHIGSGLEIPTESYSDQPYVVRTDDGGWLCAVTTGAGHEGQKGQHVVTMRSMDCGRTWSSPVDVEPAAGPEASYAVLLKAPGGRIYCFYNHNTDNIRRVKADNPPYADGYCYRVDSLGYFVFKYSDDHGQSWSAQRYPIPVREFEIDRTNADRGEIRYFWNVGKPFVAGGAAFCPLHKVGGFGSGFFTRSEGVLLKSPNLLYESDPARIVWETFPDGDTGLRTPPGGGPIAEEQSFAVLSDGSLYSVYRSVDGHPVCSYSRDGGHTWSVPQYKRYADGSLMKHPRAANFVWKCASGNYLYWFHNHGGNDYADRNPVWICAGAEADSEHGKVIRWSQPEILLYDDDTYIRMSYPDLLEEGGKVYITETQKDVARVHEIDGSFLSALRNQFEHAEIASRSLLLELDSRAGGMPQQTSMPGLSVFLDRDNSRSDYGTLDYRTGFTLEMWIAFHDLEAGQTVLESALPSGQGFRVRVAAGRTLEIALNDGRTENLWSCDPGMLQEGRLHHVGIVVDGGPKIITFVIDGKLCDGGEFRQFGWGRFNPNLRHVSGAETLRLGSEGRNELNTLRIYGRALMTSEVVGNYKAGAARRAGQ